MKNQIILVLFSSVFIFSDCLWAGRLNQNNQPRTEKENTIEKANYNKMRSYKFIYEDNSLDIIYRKIEKNTLHEVIIQIDDEDTQDKDRSIRLKQEIKKGFWITVCGYWIKCSMFPLIYKQVSK